MKKFTVKPKNIKASTVEVDRATSEKVKLHCSYTIERTDANGDVDVADFTFTLPALPYCWAFESLFAKLGLSDSTDLFDFEYDDIMNSYPTIDQFVDALAEFNEDPPVVSISRSGGATKKIIINELTDELTGTRYI